MSDQSLIDFEKWWKENGKHEGKGYAIVKEYSLCKEVWEAAYNCAELREVKINRAFVELSSKFFKLQEELFLAKEAARSEAEFVNELRAENIKLKEALIACPILGEFHSDSNDRFKEWNYRHEYILKKLWEER